MNARSPRTAGRLLLLLAPLLAGACSGPRATAGTVRVEIVADGESQAVNVPSGSTVLEILRQADLEVGEFDRVEPRTYTVVTEGTLITITRIQEGFEIEEMSIPFERQTLRNESLAEGETRLLQPGMNGLEEVTYRVVKEEGVEVSRSPVKRVVLLEPQSEVLMIGSQASYSPISVAGTLAYEIGGNAWIIRGDTGGRRPLVLTGDLDGFVFRLSPDSRWLLYSRREEGEQINSLWIISTTQSAPEPFPLEVENVVHFADWVPNEPNLTVAYSTVEASPAAPGWQANNDLNTVTFAASGRVVRRDTLLEPNAGGQYGWWGTSFVWSPDGLLLAYARADSVGIIDVREPEFNPLLSITPFQTFGDWAWVPGIAWGQSGRTLYSVDHGPPLGFESPGASPAFDLIALSPDGGMEVPISPRTGMFAFPAASPGTNLPTGETAFQIAFLQAISPLESETSSYQLMVMDRDGSNLRALFPNQGDPGIEPPQQPPAWSPDGERIAFLYRNDLWVVEVDSGVGQRLTSDGQTGTYDWKP